MYKLNNGHLKHSSRVYCMYFATTNETLILILRHKRGSAIECCICVKSEKYIGRGWWSGEMRKIGGRLPKDSSFCSIEKGREKRGRLSKRNTKRPATRKKHSTLSGECARTRTLSFLTLLSTEKNAHMYGMWPGPRPLISSSTHKSTTCCACDNRNTCISHTIHIRHAHQAQRNKTNLWKL